MVNGTKIDAKLNVKLEISFFYIAVFNYQPFKSEFKLNIITININRVTRVKTGKICNSSKSGKYLTIYDWC